MDSSFPTHDQTLEQRRALAEEAVSYAVYLPPTVTSTRDQQHDPIQNENTTLESVQLIRTLISSIVAELAKDYIWHKDAFSLRVETSKGEPLSSQPYLKGETRIGDSLDDEWMIVFLLREITKRIRGSIARIQDNDGEFLLIEAADHIPSWLDPDSSENRVFIYEGNLYIIPIAITEEEKKSFPSTVGTRTTSPKLQDALDLIRSSSTTITAAAISTLASLKIQQAAFEPLLTGSGDQGSQHNQQTFAVRKIIEQRHFALCKVPVDIARILKTRPELITRACEAFYTRDTLAMAACSRMTKFLPQIGTSSSSISGTQGTSALFGVSKLGKNRTPFVKTAVCFTKTCYAQLMGQQFRPPKIWDGIVPPPKAEDANDPQKIREAELGMKLTCGFEILCSSDYPGDWGFKTGEDIKFEASFSRQKEANLSFRKYFGDERPGSKEYQRLEEIAKKEYLEYKSEKLRGVDNQDSDMIGSVSFRGHGYHPIQEIGRILSVELPPDDITTLIDDRKDDDDSWMDVDLRTLEDMMRARGYDGSTLNEKDRSSNNGLDMQQMLDRFEDFIQVGQGGVEGAEFLDEQSDREDEGDDESDEEESVEIDDGRMDRSSEQHDNENGVSDESSGEDEDEDDIFASDYEERQAKKRAAKRNATGGSIFVFGSEMMKFDNGVAVESTETKTKTPRAFALDKDNFKNILIDTFGEEIASVRARKSLNEDDQSDENEDMNEQELQEYMEAMDAELSGTKIGQSFEKISAKPASSTGATSSSTPSDSTSKADKGKGISPPSRKAKTEKNLEELMREHASRSRRGFSRHGPLPVSGNPYGYDPDAIAYADDEDDDEDEDMNGGDASRVTALSSDEADEIKEDTERDEVVNVDLNLAKNLLESFRSQAGLPGPGGNLLSRLGIVLPRDEAGDDDDDE
ncbi:hypothetical protein BGZ65_007130 [Modicella reniformis]|uniref:Uncharacterized protein n=1 Tax=Modicella reniformis TaxID=1440133 RepID=A0A9P6INS9_9FUNG|nr:hypothetical protein BGZ65_007130 [Modicella reniformis]